MSQAPPPPPTTTTATATTQQLPTLDLHGYRKEAAIRAVTDFLDVQSRLGNQMVSIITGTGAHSAAGPVLRTAVTSLLQRRQMEFSRGDTAGSVKVNCQSGHVWTMRQQTAVDTKLVVINGDDAEAKIVLPSKRNNKKQNEKRRKFAHHHHHHHHHHDSGSRSVSSNSDSTVATGPTVTEVACEEQALQKAKEMSRDEYIQLTRQEKAALQRAKRESKQQSAREEAAWEAMLARTVQFSKQEQTAVDTAGADGLDQDDLILEQALRESLEQHQQRQSSSSLLTDDELQALMEQAIQESQQQQQRQQQQSNPLWTDEELQALTDKALQISLHETNQIPTSNNNGEDKDDDEEKALLQEILVRSISETTGP